MSIKRLLMSTFATVLLAAAGSASAAPLLQYASTVKGFSSEYGTGDNSWSSRQVLGAPNTFGYGDIGTSWAPRPRDGTLEYISVGFDTAVFATGATIRETWGNGFVYQVDLIDTLGNLHQVWSGVDPSTAGAPYDFSISWDATAFLVNGLKVYVNTSLSGDWEEIDSIQLAGNAPAQVPEPTSLALMGAGLALCGGLRRRRRA
ncbi:PEP-CTERM sorting domain-containing protein [Massilia sp. LjRoot122]|uniref:PEP-CTERM sorting domain-containing protein n=1 Tax=Massilia sp. LjRoot122 TaxID=3342257 RepID=UPI003ECC55B6